MPNTMVSTRWAIRADWRHILDIERATFGGWTRDDLESLSKRKATVAGRVAVMCGQVVGFVFYELVGDRLRVLNLAAVTPGARAELIAGLRASAKACRCRLVWCG